MSRNTIRDWLRQPDETEPKYPTRTVHSILDPYQEQFSGWQHYIPAVIRKPGALRNGAPFMEMPESLKHLQRHLLKRAGGDRVMAQILAVVPVHGLEAVLVATELAPESGAPNSEHVLNTLAELIAAKRIKSTTKPTTREEEPGTRKADLSTET